MSLLRNSEDGEAGFSATIGCLEEDLIHASISRRRSASESIAITVADVVTNLGPICSAAYPSISEIWSPDQRVVPISILGLTDPGQ